MIFFVIELINKVAAKTERKSKIDDLLIEKINETIMQGGTIYAHNGNRLLESEMLEKKKLDNNK